VPFARELYIEADDFLEEPPKKFFRLAPGREVRLRYAYFIKCVDVIKDETGAVTELHCTYDPETKGGDAPDGRKVKGTLHWVAARESLPAEVRLYDRLYLKQNPDDVAPGKDHTSNVNPESKVVLRGSRIEPSVVDDPPGSRYQFERQGYFCSDAVDSRPDALAFNRTVGLRDTWAKVAAEKPKPAPRTPRRKREAYPPHRAKPEAVASPELDGAVQRYRSEFGLSDEQAKVLAGDARLATLFDQAVAVHDNPRGLASWIVGDLSRILREREADAPPVSGEQIGSLVGLIDDGTISRASAKEVLAELLEHGGHPGEIVERRGLRLVSDRSAIEPIVAKLIAGHPDKVEAYRGGRTGLLGFFVGQAMKETGGKADPEVVKDTVLAQLS
jgi:glutaminyl-tRNA synthetase